MASKYQIIPSIISRKPSEYQKTVKALEKYADIIQFDVMDNKFVKGKTFDHRLVKKIKTKARKEVHLMTINPLKDLEKYVKAGASIIIFHIEAIKGKYAKEKIIAASRKIKSRKIKFGLALNPSTPIKKITPYIRYCDKILLMTRVPGKASMPFDPKTLLKIKQLRSMKSMRNKDIEVDGSIDRITISYAKKAGASHFVIGSAIFENNCIKDSIKELEKILNSKD